MSSKIYHGRSANFLGGLFFIVPGLNIYILIKHGNQVKLPFNELHFVFSSFALGSLCFCLVWLAAFSFELKESLRLRESKLAALFFYLIWTSTSMMSFAYINQAFDRSPKSNLLATITAKQMRYMSGGRHHGSRQYCFVDFQPELFGVRAKPLKSGYCELIRPGVDGINFITRGGFLGWAWLEDYAIVKDHRTVSEANR